MTDINWDCYIDPPNIEIDWDSYIEIEIDGEYYLCEKTDEDDIDTSFIEEEDEEIHYLIQSEPPQDEVS